MTMKEQVTRKIHWVLLFALAGFLSYGFLHLPMRGDPEAPAAQHVSPHYIEQGLTETATPNMVSAIIADYRSFDTLGETLVIFTAGLACTFLMGKKREKT